MSQIGEAAVGNDANAAHVNTVLGHRNGPVGAAWATARQAYSAMTEDTMLSSVALPLGPASVIAPIGFFVICVMMLIDLPRVGNGDAMLFSQDAPTT